MGDLDYYQRRLTEELREVARSDRSDVREVHARLAQMYRDRVERLAGKAVAPAYKAEVSALQAIMQDS